MKNMVLIKTYPNDIRKHKINKEKPYNNGKLNVELQWKDGTLTFSVQDQVSP